MNAGQPFSLKQILPPWLPVEDFYVGITAAGALICLVAVFSYLNPRNKMIARVKAIQERHQAIRGGASFQSNKRIRPEMSVNFMRQVVTRLQLLKKNQIGKLETLLIEAGYHSKDIIIIIAFLNLVLPIILGGIGLASLSFTQKLGIIKYAIPIGLMYVGIKLPWWYVVRVRRKRYLKIQRALPDTLDLMTICAEAGLSLGATLDRVSRELAISYPEMGDELTITSAELSFLPERNKALSNLSERCKLPELRGVVNVLIQTEKYGTPIAQALRVLSAEFRQARMLRAEQKAARLPALMTVPMIVFVLPTLFIVILAPAIIRVMDIFAKQQQ
ncbi:MAG: type II secretion system F family protein [Rickettsiales bacterium]|nr:type II secretion system F family protein [Rickettsiales bacterium]